MDKVPYIIVDNLKIPPLERSPRSGTATRDEAGPQETPFGIVDRVTLSREGLEKSRQQQDLMEDEPPALDHFSKTGTPLLTYSPKMPR